MKTILVLVLITAALIWVGRIMRRREIEKFRASDQQLLHEFRQEVSPHSEEDVIAAAEPAAALAIPDSKPVVAARQIVLAERHRRVLDRLESILNPAFRVFVHMPLTDFLTTAEAGSVSFLLCDRGYLSPVAVVEFEDQVNHQCAVLLAEAAVPLIAVAGTETAEVLRDKLEPVRADLVGAEATSQRCPNCRADMKLRTPSEGKLAGKRFWLCSRYPACRGTRPAHSSL